MVTEADVPHELDLQSLSVEFHHDSVVVNCQSKNSPDSILICCQVQIIVLKMQS